MSPEWTQKQCNLKSYLRKVNTNILTAVLTWLIFNFGKQEHCLKETWHNFYYFIQHSSTVLELRSSRLAWSRRLWQKNKKFVFKCIVFLFILSLIIIFLESISVPMYLFWECTNLRQRIHINICRTHKHPVPYDSFSCTLAGQRARYSLTISNRKSGFSFSRYSTPRGSPCKEEKCASTASFSKLVTSSCDRWRFIASTARRYNNSFNTYIFFKERKRNRYKWTESTAKNWQEYKMNKRHHCEIKQSLWKTVKSHWKTQWSRRCLSCQKPKHLTRICVFLQKKILPLIFQ